MKKRFSEEQIVATLRAAEPGAKRIAERDRARRVSAPTCGLQLGGRPGGAGARDRALYSCRWC